MIDKNILLVGFTKRTSFAVAKILGKNNKIFISDSVSNEEKLSLIKELESYGINLTNLLGNQSKEILNEYKIDLIIVSPGVPLNIPLLISAKQKNIEVIGDIELFYRFFPSNIYIGITGTDGKTTTTTLVYELLKTEQKTLLGGNIGLPVFELFNEIKNDDKIVLELSSFQLEAIKNFKPHIGLFLNLAEDHLDRYSSMEEYLNAKKRIFMNQTEEDFAIVNLDSPYYEKIIKGVKSKILTFSITNENATIYYKDNTIFYEKKPFIDRDEIFIKGIHNVENSMAAILAAKLMGVSEANIKNVLKNFKGVEHRLEFVRNINGVDYYNDSKSTTVNSLEKALLSFDRPIILIAGGRDKGLDFTKIKELAHKKLKTLVLIGEAKDKIKKELDFKESFYASDLEEAVKISKQKSSPGDIILLSPGCASFDMFKNYEERGKVYKEIVNKL
ncbi:MAG: UDP-N-acetylmuramoyl-L-alanine--D-glutamate ligase [Brevinematales bacterium]|nr:UDP-N-acetylmuramoyl-L-alanine--D-glutamate ligase [Brevinematales bacterium]